MPRIAADSIAEHRAQREQAIVEAGLSIATTSGIDAVTIASVAEQVGLTRTSMYEYVTSTRELRDRIRTAQAAARLESLDDVARQIVDAVRALATNGAVPAQTADAFIRGGLAALPPT